MFRDGPGSTDWSNDTGRRSSSSSVCSSEILNLISRAGKKIDQTELGERAEGFRKNVHLQSSAYYTSAHVLDDGIIDPRDTRDVLGMCLEIVAENGTEGNVGFGGVSRL